MRPIIDTRVQGAGPPPMLNAAATSSGSSTPGASCATPTRGALTTIVPVRIGDGGAIIGVGAAASDPEPTPAIAACPASRTPAEPHAGPVSTRFGITSFRLSPATTTAPAPAISEGTGK